MELRCILVELAGGEMLPGCRRDANIRTQIEVRFNWDKEETPIWEPSLRGDTNLETCIGLRWDLEWVEMHILRRRKGDMGLGWSWLTIRQFRKDPDGSETHILKPVWVWDDAWVELRCNLVALRWRWDVTWKKVRYKYQEQYWGKIQLRQRRKVNLGAWAERRHKTLDLDGVDMGPGLGWDAHLETRMGWYGTGMELRYNSPVEK